MATTKACFQLSLAILIAAHCGAIIAADPEPWAMVDGVVLEPGSAEEGIVYDSESGNYTVTYETYNGSLYRVVYYPPTKIEPKVESLLSRRGFDIRYKYRITNGNKAQQPLSNIRMLVTRADDSSFVSPNGWDNIIATGYNDPNVAMAILNVGWYSVQGIPVGETLDFYYKSKDLPGVGLIEMLGANPSSLFLEGGPHGELGEKFDELQDKSFVSYLAPIPLIRTSYNHSRTLRNIRDYFEQLLKMELVEPVFADRLTKLLDAAAEADGLQDRASALSHLEEFRAMLDEAQHADDKATLEAPINKLAARVLRFDGEYVRKRISSAR